MTQRKYFSCVWCEHITAIERSALQEQFPTEPSMLRSVEHRWLRHPEEFLMTLSREKERAAQSGGLAELAAGQRLQGRLKRRQVSKHSTQRPIIS